MATTARTGAPIHLWIAGVLSLIWSSFGCYDYVMTRTSNVKYLADAMPGVDPNTALEWVNAMPLYAQVGWGLGVWLAPIGAILLLMRSRWAVWAYGLSFIGAVLSLGYQLLLAPPLPGAEAAIYKIMPVVIILVCAALVYYARAMKKRGVLR